MNGLWSATLDSRSPRYAHWNRILGGDDVPLKSPASFLADFGGLGEKHVEVYAVDLAKFSPDQTQRLIEFITERFGAPASEVSKELATNGFPIRAADVFIAFSLRAFI